MRHLRLRLLSVSILILFLFATSSLAQQTGGQDIKARDLTISESLYNYAIHRQIYGGNNDNFRSNYQGTGGLLFDWQADDLSVFLCTKAGNANLLGPLTTYMLGLKDTDRTHALVLKWNENDTADRVLNFLVNGANRTIDLSNDLVITALTNTRLLATDGVGSIVSSDLADWMTGTANRISITDNGDGTVTVSSPQDSDVTASPIFTGMTLTGLTGTRLVATTGADALTSSDLFGWVAGTTNQVNIADDGDGSVTLSTPQDIDATASPTFAGATFSGLTASKIVLTDGVKALTSAAFTSALLAGQVSDETGSGFVVFGTQPTFTTDITIGGVDPGVILDGSTASDTDFWMALIADEVGDDNDDLKIGKGTTIGTTPFFKWDENGGFQSQNLTDSTTAVQILDADGGVPVWNVDTVDERIGIGTASPTVELHVIGTIAASGIVRLTSSGVPIEFVNGAVKIGRGLLAQGGNDLVVVYHGDLHFYDNQNTLVRGTFQENTGNFGIGDNFTGPDRKLDVLDASAKQYRSTHTDGTVYSEWGTDANGDFELLTSGDEVFIPEDVIIGAGTKSDGFVTRAAAEVQTGDATVTTIDSFTLLDENTYHVEAKVVGVESDGSQRASYHIAATVYRTGAGNATLQGTVTSLHTQESDPGWNCTFTVNGNDVRVSVTGDASTIEWGCILDSVNMSN